MESDKGSHLFCLSPTTCSELAELVRDVRALKELIETRLTAHNRQHELEGTAISTARAEMNRRLEGMNEFRAQISAAENKYLNRNEWETAHRLLEQQVRAVENTLMENRSTSMTLAAFDQFRKAYEDWRSTITTRIDRKEGETSGVRLTGGLVLSIILAVSAGLGIIGWLLTHSWK